jgi:hypothetical protein
VPFRARAGLAIVLGDVSKRSGYGSIERCTGSRDHETGVDRNWCDALTRYMRLFSVKIKMRVFDRQ